MAEDDPVPRKKAPRRDGDEVERRLAELQAELEAESEKAKQAVAESKKGVATSGRRRPAKPAPEPDEEAEPAAAEVEGEAEVVPDEAPLPPADELAATEPGPERKLARPKAAPTVREKAEAAAGAAVGEIAAETLAGKKPGEAALTVVTRRLPSLPTKEDFRNGALAVTGVALGGWLAWGFIAPVLAFLWTVTKVAVLGGLVYGGYKVYGALPGKGADPGRDAEAGQGTAEADPEADPEDEARPRARDKTR